MRDIGVGCISSLLLVWLQLLYELVWEFFSSAAKPLRKELVVSMALLLCSHHRTIRTLVLSTYACENFARLSARVWLGNFFSRLNWNRWRLSKSSLYSLIWYQNLKFFTVSFDAFDSITVDSTLDLASPANLDSIFVLSLPILSSLVFFSL